ncbi:MAG: sensor domain-containing diguanylate cyclase [Sideroxydans sp.]|nr:sensor domain-containing diguanylate cyclase [Sideroxydans sp.]
MTHAEQREKLLESTGTLLATLGQSPLESDILQTSIQALADLMQVKYGAIRLLDEHGQLSQFVHTGADDEDATAGRHALHKHDFLGMPSHHDSSPRMREMAGDPQHPHDSQRTSLLAVTITHQDKLYGRIYLRDKLNQQAFNTEDESLAYSFAKVLALILDNAHKLETLTQAHGELSHTANHDALTQLPNRTLLCDRIGQVLCHALRYQSQVAIMFCDLDGFKAINDSLGHDVGDAVLKTVGERLLNSVRGNDTVARIGGDEFVFVLPEIESIEQIGLVAHKILHALTQQLHVDGHAIQLSGSIGIAIYPFDGETSGQLIKNADAAMYWAKESGKNCYKYYTGACSTGNVAQPGLFEPVSYGEACPAPYPAN